MSRMSAPSGQCAVPDSKTGEVTSLLRAWREGDADALGHASTLLYPELRRQARLYMRRESPGHVLQTTALVHEAFLRLVDSDAVDWNDRTHFLAAAARVMRHVLVDLAAPAGSSETGGARAPCATRGRRARRRSALGRHDRARPRRSTRLPCSIPRKARVVELRFFGGLTVEETARVLQVSMETIQRDWRLARSWLLKTLTEGPQP